MIRALAFVLMILGGGLAAQSRALRYARADLVQVRAELVAARAFGAARLALDRAAVDAARLDDDLQRGVGADAPLSNYLRGYAGRVWPEN